MLNRHLHNSSRIIAVLRRLQMKYNGVTLIHREKYRVSQLHQETKIQFFFLPRILRIDKDSVISSCEKNKY